MSPAWPPLWQPHETVTTPVENSGPEGSVRPFAVELLSP